MNHHEQIPVWGSINFQFLYQVHLSQSNGRANSTTINDLVGATSKEIGCNMPLAEFWSPVNAGTVFSFLYSSIVVPKELFSGDASEFFDSFSIGHADIFKHIEFGEEKLNSTPKILRFLRNSVSHVNYRVDPEDHASVLMWNENRQGDQDIRIVTDINLLANFGLRFAQHYATYQTTGRRIENDG